MARVLRVQYPGACYHVINRGNYRRNLFEDSSAADAFVRTLGEAATRFTWRIHAYVVMRNHFHLALEIAEPNLSEGMKWLQGTWVRRFNGFHSLKGHPFQGRFKALLVEPGYAFAQVCHYIHLNPLRAGAVSFETFATYRHSSYRAFTAKRRPAWLDATTVLDSTTNEDSAAGWKRYLNYLDVLSSDNSARREMTSVRLSRGWCVGSPAFKKELVARVRETAAGSRFLGVDAAGAKQLKEELWAEQLHRLAQRAGVDLSNLPPKKCAPEKVLLAAGMKQSTSASNGWLCRRLQMGAPKGLCVCIRRWTSTSLGARRLRDLMEVER